MANIDVVPKSRSNTWLWIVIAIVVIALLFWAFAARSSASELHGQQSTDTVAGLQVSSAVWSAV
jgi:bacteriorhodopsin